MPTLFLARGPELSQVLNGAECHLHTVSQWEAVSWESVGERVLVGTQRGLDEKEEVEEEEAIGSVHGEGCAHSQPHAGFPPSEKGVRKCNFSVWLLTESLRRFLLGCGVGCLPSPVRDRLARIREFRCYPGNSPGEEVVSNASAWRAWGFGFQDVEVTSRTLGRVSGQGTVVISLTGLSYIGSLFLCQGMKPCFPGPVPWPCCQHRCVFWWRPA